MNETTIVLILITLAVIAYYTDPFGWDPSGRFGGRSDAGLAAALLFLVAGVGLAIHYDLVPRDSLAREYARGSDALLELRRGVDPETVAAARGQITQLFEQAVAGLETTAHAISQWMRELGVPAPGAVSPPSTS